MTDWSGKAYLTLYFAHVTIFHVSEKCHVNSAGYGIMARSFAPGKNVAIDWPATYVILRGKIKFDFLP